MQTEVSDLLIHAVVTANVRLQDIVERFWLLLPRLMLQAPPSVSKDGATDSIRRGQA